MKGSKMIDPTLFGLQPETEVKFFTPDEAAKIPGVTSGYNAVYNISKTRVRYELLKAGKAQGGDFVPVTTVAEVVAEPTPEPVVEPVVEVKQEVVEPVQEVIEQPVQEPVAEVKEEVVAEPTVEEKAAKKAKK